MNCRVQVAEISMTGGSDMSNYRQIEKMLDGFVEDGLPGCGCAFARDGVTLFEHYAGIDHVKTQHKLDAHTTFRQCSTTKIIIVTAGMMLYERGKFLLNDPLYEYFPEYKESTVVEYDANGDAHIRPAKSPILVKDAFRMTCGMPYEWGDSITAKAMWDVKRELEKKYGTYDIETEVAAMGTVPKAFDPGTHWLYGYGHDIVSGLIQRLSGMPTGEFLRKEIFEPLGMNETAYRFHDGNESKLCDVFHPNGDGTWHSEPGILDRYHVPEAKLENGGAGLYSTVSDYLKFTQMLANGGKYHGEQIIGRKTIDLMRENQLDTKLLRDFQNFYLAGYGYGLGVRTLLSRAEANFNATPGEFGWTGAYGTYVSIDPAEHFSLVYMHQTDPNNEQYYHLRVRNAVYGAIE